MHSPDMSTALSRNLQVPTQAGNYESLRGVLVRLVLNVEAKAVRSWTEVATNVLEPCPGYDPTANFQ
jgi:hypothetical protein